MLRLPRAGSKGGPGKQILIFQGRLAGARRGSEGRKLVKQEAKQQNSVKINAHQGTWAACRGRPVLSPKEFCPFQKRYCSATWNGDQTPGIWPSLTSLCSSRHYEDEARLGFQCFAQIILVWTSRSSDSSNKYQIECVYPAVQRPGDCIIIFLIEPRLPMGGKVVDRNAKHRRASQHTDRYCWIAWERIALFVRTCSLLWFQSSCCSTHSWRTFRIYCVIHCKEASGVFSFSFFFLFYAFMPRKKN